MMDNKSKQKPVFGRPLIPFFTEDGKVNDTHKLPQDVAKLQKDLHVPNGERSFSVREFKDGYFEYKQNSVDEIIQQQQIDFQDATEDYDLPQLVDKEHYNINSKNQETFMLDGHNKLTSPSKSRKAAVQDHYKNYQEMVLGNKNNSNNAAQQFINQANIFQRQNSSPERERLPANGNGAYNSDNVIVPIVRNNEPSYASIVAKQQAAAAQAAVAANGSSNSNGKTVIEKPQTPTISDITPASSSSSQTKPRKLGFVPAQVNKILKSKSGASSSKPNAPNVPEVQQEEVAPAKASSADDNIQALKKLLEQQQAKNTTVNQKQSIQVAIPQQSQQSKPSTRIVTPLAAVTAEKPRKLIAPSFFLESDEAIESPKSIDSVQEFVLSVQQEQKQQQQQQVAPPPQHPIPQHHGMYPAQPVMSYPHPHLPHPSMIPPPHFVYPPYAPPQMPPPHQFYPMVDPSQFTHQVAAMEPPTTPPQASKMAQYQSPPPSNHTSPFESSPAAENALLQTPPKQEQGANSKVYSEADILAPFVGSGQRYAGSSIGNSPAPKSLPKPKFK